MPVASTIFAGALPHRKEFVSKAVVAAFPALASIILNEAFICSDCSKVMG